MYIPELDALIFLATEFSGGSVDQPSLKAGVKALHEAAGGYKPGETPKRSKVPERFGRRACIDLLEQLGLPLEEDVLPVIWEALGGTDDISLVTVGLLLALICQADFDATAAFVFWLLDKDGDHRLTKGDVLGAIGPLMCVAQAGVVFKGTAEEDSRKAASVWDDFRDSMRELATDKVAAAIATGAYDEVDAHRTGRIQEQQFRVMIECVATDVATMMVDVTEMQGEVERASGSRLDSSSSPATGVKTALHKLVTKYAGGEVAERLLGVPAKPRRKSGMSTGRRPMPSTGSSPQQASRLSGLRGRASQQPSASSSRQGSGQMPFDARSASTSNPGLGSLQQGGTIPPSQRSPSQSLTSSRLRTQGSQPPLLKPQGSPEWQSNIAYSPLNSITSQQSNKVAGVPLSVLTQQGSTPLMQQSSTQGIRFTSTPRLGAAQSVGSAAGDVPGGMAYEGTSPLPQAILQHEGSQQQPTGDFRLGVHQPEPHDPGGSSAARTWDSATQGNLLQPQGSADQPQGYQLQPQGSAAQPSLRGAPLAQQSSAAAQQTEAAGVTTPGGLRGQLQQSRLQEPRTISDMQRQSWFQNGLNDDGQDPNLHNPRDPDAERRNSGAMASPSAPSASPRAGPFDLGSMSMQADAALQAQEEERTRLRSERMHRANRAAAAARAAIKADIKAQEDADHASQIDPKKAAILLAAGLTVRYYLLDIVKIMVILAILLGDAAFVVVLYARRGLSLELSLGIVFFTNIVLSLAALIYIVTGINTDLFLWAKDYIVSLKDEDSAVNAKKDSTLSKLAAMEGAVPKQLQPTFKKVMQKLQQAGGKDKSKGQKRSNDDEDDVSTTSDLEPRSSSRYGDYDEDSGAGSRQPSASKGRLGAGGGRTRVQFARGSRLGLGQGGGSRRGATHRPAGDKQDPQDYMSKAKQLWNYVGKFTGLEGVGGNAQGDQDLSPPDSGHSRSFGRQWHSNSSRSMRPGLSRSRLGRGQPPGVADDYKSAALLQRAEEGDSNAVYPQRIPSHAKPVMRDANSKNWAAKDRRGSASKDAYTGDEEYAGLV
ncbi:hypothetical protein ABBQ38_002532 [Trebouxia sp. C0009 RCD-2024]